MSGRTFRRLTYVAATFLLSVPSAFGSIVRSPLWGIDLVAVQVILQKGQDASILVNLTHTEDQAISLLQESLSRHHVTGVRVIKAREEPDIYSPKTATLRIFVSFLPSLPKDTQSKHAMLVVSMEARRYGVRELDSMAPTTPEATLLRSDGSDAETRLLEVLSPLLEMVGETVNHPYAPPSPPAVDISPLTNKQ